MWKRSARLLLLLGSAAFLLCAVRDDAGQPLHEVPFWPFPFPTVAFLYRGCGYEQRVRLPAAAASLTRGARSV